MSTAFDLVTFDAPEPDLLASFWAAALDLVELQREDGDRWIVVDEPDGTRRIGVQRGPVRIGTVHLDLTCAPAEFDAELTRLRALGATLDRPVRVESYGSIANLLDPFGQPFDLCAYR